MIQVLLTWLLSPLLRLLAGRVRRPPRRVLVIQAAKIGDALCATPLIRELGAGLPAAEIDILAGPAAAPLLANLPGVREVLVAAAGDWRGVAGKLRLAGRLRRRGYDAVLCCNGGAVWPMVALWAGIPERIGLLPNFAGASTRLAGRLWTAAAAHRGDRLIVETYFDMLRLLGLAPADPAKEARPAPGAGERVAGLLPAAAARIGLAVSAANKLKELGPDKLAAVAEGLLVRLPEARLVLLGTAADRQQAQEILARLAEVHRQRIADLCGRVDLADLPALMAGLQAFVGVDSGLTYLADTLGLPLVSVAGPCNMAETRPVNPRARILQLRLPCLPCAHIFQAPGTCRVGTRACILDIGSEEIVAATVDVLTEARP